MLSLFIALLVIVGAPPSSTTAKVVFTADETLAILRENGGSFPSPPIAWKNRPGRQAVSAGTALWIPLFYRHLERSGHGCRPPTPGEIAAVDRPRHGGAQQIWREGRRRGFMEDYRYIVYTADAQTQMIFFGLRAQPGYVPHVCAHQCGHLRSGAAVRAAIDDLLLRAHRQAVFRELRKQKRFITDAGTKLKTPLTIIDADTEILSMDLGENEWLSDIQSQTRRLADLTNNLILLSRMQEEQPQSQRIDFPLSDVVEETAMSVQALAKTQDKGADHPNPAHDRVQRGRRGAIRRLVTVLLDNAVKYSQPQGRIALSLCKQRNLGAPVGVQHDGIHLQGGSWAPCLTAFTRADQSRNSQTGGYGLGLSIAAAIVSAHRGKIWASTEG